MNIMAEETPQQPFDDEFERIVRDQAARDAQEAEQREYDERFQDVVDPSGLDRLGRQITDDAQALRDHGETTATEILNPDPHDDETLARLAEREKKIREWTAEAVEKFGDDPAEAEARYRKMWTDSDKQLAENVKAYYDAGAALIEGQGAQIVANLTPKENRMRGLIQRGGRRIGRIFGFGLGS